MILNGDELDGVKLLGRKTVDLMLQNHTGDKEVYILGPGYGYGYGYGFGFGLGFGVLENPEISYDFLSKGSYSWGGAYGTLYFADPVEEVVGIMFIQLPGHMPLNIRQRFTNVVSQAIIE